MLTGNSQEFCTKQKIDENIGEVYYLILLRSQDAPLKSSNAQNLAHASKVSRPCPAARTSGDCYKT